MGSFTEQREPFSSCSIGHDSSMLALVWHPTWVTKRLYMVQVSKIGSSVGKCATAMNADPLPHPYSIASTILGLASAARTSKRLSYPSNVDRFVVESESSDGFSIALCPIGPRPLGSSQGLRDSRGTSGSGADLELGCQWLGSWRMAVSHSDWACYREAGER